MTDRRRVLPPLLLAAAYVAPATGWVLLRAAPVRAQAMGPDVASATRNAAPSATEALLADVPFHSKVEGVEFRPPAGGTKIQQLNTRELVRYAYPNGWTLVLMSAPNSTRLPLVTDPAHPDRLGLLDVAVAQLTQRAAKPATLVGKPQVVPMGAREIGTVEARDNAGINCVFTQIAVIPDRDRFFTLQMLSPGQDEHRPGLAGQAGLGLEDDARQMFRRVLATVAVTDRGSFRAEQGHRLIATTGLWLELDQRRIEPALQDRHFMRIVRDGKDVGYVQVNERSERRHGQDGYAVILREHVELPPAPPAAPAPGAAATPATPGVDVPQPKAASAAQARPTQLDRDARFWVTFDRGHEEWTSVTRLDNRLGSDAVEMGNSDVETHRMFNAAAQREQVRGGRKAADEPPVIDRSIDTLRVDTYRGKVRSQNTFETKLVPAYLPQALAQLLPRLLPTDQPRKYMFAFYVTDQRQVLWRYVDVEAEREAELDGRTVRAIPITDRVGADGVTTTHYVNRADGQWLGTVGDAGKLQVLPTDDTALKSIWHGFQVLPDPPPPADDDTTTTKPPSGR